MSQGPGERHVPWLASSCHGDHQHCSEVRPGDGGGVCLSVVRFVLQDTVVTRCGENIKNMFQIVDITIAMTGVRNYAAG